MKAAAEVTSWPQLKALSDPRRLRLLRLLMAQPATLSQLAAQTGHSPAWVRHHLLRLQRAGLVELDHVRTTGRVREKYYRATAGALVLRRLVLPAGERPVAVFAGSHDLALERLAEQLQPHLDIVAYPVGSLDGLIDLRQRLCHFSGAHLLDESGAYNLPYIRRLFPDHAVQVVTLAHRVQGLMVAPGNPKGVRSLTDLSRPDLRFVNRNGGSGTRIWLDAHLAALGIPREAVRGYETTVATHTAAAHAVAAGQADVALGLEAAARAAGLDFIPLFEERFDLVVPREETDTLHPLLDALQTASWRRLLASLPGYHPAHTGETLAL